MLKKYRYLPGVWTEDELNRSDITIWVRFDVVGLVLGDGDVHHVDVQRDAFLYCTDCFREHASDLRLLPLPPPGKCMTCGLVCTHGTLMQELAIGATRD